MANNWQVPVPARATLDQMADAIDKHVSPQIGVVPHRARVEDLNKARVALKHSGMAPSREDTTRLVRYGVEFLETASPQYFGVEYRSIRSPLGLLQSRYAISSERRRQHSSLSNSRSRWSRLPMQSALSRQSSEHCCGNWGTT